MLHERGQAAAVRHKGRAAVLWPPLLRQLSVVLLLWKTDPATASPIQEQDPNKRIQAFVSEQYGEMETLQEHYTWNSGKCFPSQHCDKQCYEDQWQKRTNLSAA